MKKIGIIGGGFYGCYLANKLKDKFKSKIKIDIFEKNNKLILEAGQNNQHKLHLGFHYPRSIETIKQVIIGSKKFTSEFKKFIIFPKLNLYLIHKNSLVSADKFFKIFKRQKLKITKFDIKKLNIIRNPNDYSGAFKVKEGVILFKKLNEYLIKKVKKNNRIFFNKKIVKINSKFGCITDQNNTEYGNYDYIINCTYTNPNMGMKINTKVKYEFAGMVEFKNHLNKVVGITIMDGKFVTLYPKNKSNFTISSVKYTPIKRFNKLDDLYKFQKNFNKSNKNIELILKDASKYFNNKLIIKKPKLITAPKTKVFNDKNDKRPSILTKNQKIFSVMIGKIDVAPIIFEKLLKYLK